MERKNDNSGCVFTPCPDCGENWGYGYYSPLGLKMVVSQKIRAGKQRFVCVKCRKSHSLSDLVLYVKAVYGY